MNIIIKVIYKIVVNLIATLCSILDIVGTARTFSSAFHIAFLIAARKRKIPKYLGRFRVDFPQFPVLRDRIITEEKRDGGRLRIIVTTQNLARYGGALCLPSPIPRVLPSGILIDASLGKERIKAAILHELGHIKAGVFQKYTDWCFDEKKPSKNDPAIICLNDELAADEWAIRHGAKISSFFTLSHWVCAPIMITVRYLRAKKLEAEMGI